MSWRAFVNLLVSIAVAFVALIIIAAAANVEAASSLVQPYVDASLTTAASTQTPTSSLALPQVITTLQPFLGITPSPLPIRIGIDPHSGYVYIVCQLNNIILVLRDIQVVGLIDRGATPFAGDHGIAINPVSGYTYIGNAHYIGNAYLGQISVLTGSRLITTIQNMVGDYFIGANPVNGYVYATNSDGDIAVLSGTEMITSIPSAFASFVQCQLEGSLGPQSATHVPATSASQWRNCH